jgi:hypothetical protein
MEEKKILFKPNHTVFARFHEKIGSLTPDSAFEKNRNIVILTIVDSMHLHSDQWDDFCQINIGWLGDQFITGLSNAKNELSKKELDKICSICFRFLFELYLSMKNNLSIELENARKFVIDNVDAFEPEARQNINFAIRDMPINIFKMIANSESINSIKDFDILLTKASNLKETWEKDLTSREKRVDHLKSELSKHENAFNFVGLFQGFDELAKEKEIEKSKLLFWLKMLGGLVITPIIIELIFLYINLKDLNPIKEGILFSALPTISLIAILIYYFRVLLFNYKSVKSQILQIDLRKTLCRFIQSYSEYSSKIKEKNPESLSKFENMIFSGIISDDSQLPSTYDGIDQINKIIKSIKS